MRHFLQWMVIAQLLNDYIIISRKNSSRHACRMWQTLDMHVSRFRHTCSMQWALDMLSYVMGCKMHMSPHTVDTHAACHAMGTLSTHFIISAMSWSVDASTAPCPGGINAFCISRKLAFMYRKDACVRSDGAGRGRQKDMWHDIIITTRLTNLTFDHLLSL